MPKKKQQAKRSKGQNAMPRLQRQVASGLDAAAAAHLRMLADPCGADMVQPVYAGTGTGYLVRTRNVIGPVAGATDMLVEFCPNRQAGSSGVYGYATVGGSGLGTVTSFDPPGFVTSVGGADGMVGSYRCVAACLKVVYYGSVVNCQGRVGLISNPNSGCSPIGGTYVGNIASFMAKAQKTHHLSEGATNEVKWVPGFADQTWVANNDIGGVNQAASSVAIAIQAAQVNTFNFEITAIWEWQPSESNNIGSSSGLLTGACVVKSRNTLNDVLNTLSSVAGGLTEFATNPTILGAGKLAYRALTYRANNSVQMSTYSKPNVKYLTM